MRVKIGTRGSKLAIIQTQRVIEKMKSVIPGLEPEIQVMKTSGDTHSGKIRPDIFVGEINEAVLMRKVDIGVHSLKDLPTKLPVGLSIACIPERLSPNDALISRSRSNIHDLPSGAIVGVSCPRRRAEIKHLRQDLILSDIRGNVDTRIEKIQDGSYDAVVVALAALERMGLQGLVSQSFGLKEVVPAPGQGALAVVCREDHDLVDKLTEIDDEKARAEATCERTFLRQLNSGCKSAAGAVARLHERAIELTAVIHEQERILLELSGKDPVELGKNAARLIAGARHDT